MWLAALIARTMVVCAVLLAVAVLAIAAVPAIFGFKTMVVTSGSMAPAIEAGDAALIRPIRPEEVQAGDVVTFAGWNSARGTTTHRVVAIKEIAGTLYFQTRGDANNTADPDLVPAAAAVGTVEFVIPRAGFVLQFTTSGSGRLLLVVLPLALILVAEMTGIVRNTARSRRADGPEPGSGASG